MCGSQFEETTSGMKSYLDVLMCVVASLKKQLLVCCSDVCGSQFEETTSGMQSYLDVLMCVVASLKKQFLVCSLS